MIRTIEGHTVSPITVDICIIGAGAAGIACAQEFLDDPSVTVAVLAGGGMAIDHTEQQLYALSTTDLPIDTASRVRGFGGTTAAWVGRWKSHDEIDFTKRAWVPFSGWPLSRADLQPYYEKARTKIAKAFVRHPKFPVRFFDSTDIQTARIPSLKKRYLHFGKTFENQYKHSPTVDVYLHVHATRLVSDGSRVTQVLAKTSQGQSVVFESKQVVLACGAIENARLLLLSDIGNEHDQVGRYYMDHPKGNHGVVTLDSVTSARLTPYISVDPTIFALRLSDVVQEREHILNSHLVLLPIFKHRSFIARVTRKLFGYPRTLEKVVVRNHLEQAPNPENRVRLGTALDTFGNALPVVEWSLSPLDQKTIVTMHRVLARELERLGIPGFVSSFISSDSSVGKVLGDASHHMGTTRMGIDPKTSVVDANCKVHTMSNLYVAGSSVFPTSGYANPTATLVALALRLAHHLQTNMRKKRVLLVGTGRRAHDVILPALCTLQDQYEIAALYARSQKTISLAEYGFEMNTISSLDDIDGSSIDVIIVAVPPTAVPSLLQTLARKNVAHCTVILDTPVVPLTNLGVLSLADTFKDVIVAEDCLGLPSVVDARRYIDAGVIGTLKHIRLFHNGYKYHAMATLKRLAHASYIPWIRNKKFGGENMVKHIVLQGGVKATLYEPRDYAQGTTLITGTDGVIADYSVSGDNVHKIQHPGSDEGMTRMKIQGYMRILEDIGDTHSPYHYSVIDALYDVVCIKVSQRLGFFFDIGWGRVSLVRLIIKALSKVMPR